MKTSNRQTFIKPFEKFQRIALPGKPSKLACRETQHRVTDTVFRKKKCLVSIGNFIVQSFSCSAKTLLDDVIL